MTNVTPAFALTSGDSTTISQEWYSDVEYSISGWTDANGDRHYSRSGQHHRIRLLIGITY